MMRKQFYEWPLNFFPVIIPHNARHTTRVELLLCKLEQTFFSDSTQHTYLTPFKQMMPSNPCWPPSPLYSSPSPPTSPPLTSHLFLLHAAQPVHHQLGGQPPKKVIPVHLKGLHVNFFYHSFNWDDHGTGSWNLFKKIRSKTFYLK